MSWAAACLLVNHKFPASPVSTAHPSLPVGTWPLAMPIPFLCMAQLLLCTCLCKTFRDGGSCLVCPNNFLTRQYRAAARAHRETSPHAAARRGREPWSTGQLMAQPSVWPLEGQDTGSCQAGSQQVVAGLDAQCGGPWAHLGWGSHGSFSPGSWQAVPGEAQLLGCSLCKPVPWAAIGIQLLGSRGLQTALWNSPCSEFLVLLF